MALQEFHPSAVNLVGIIAANNEKMSSLDYCFCKAIFS
jgi:hypothetical protein